MWKWKETCTESTKGVTLMQEIQNGLGRRMKYLAELTTISKSHGSVKLPEFVVSAGNLSVEENVIGETQYTAVNILRAKKQANYRNPEKPFKDILRGKFEQIKQIRLKGWCKRMSFIKGDIWVAVPDKGCIQVIDVGGSRKGEISCAFKPYSVKESLWGDIIVASDLGLHALFPDGTVKYTISDDKFYDVGFYVEEIVALNASKEILQTYQRAGDGEWRHSGDITASEGVGSVDMGSWDSVVTRRSEISFTMLDRSKSHYYKCVGKTGQRIEFDYSQQVMNWPLVCGVDSISAVLVADYSNKNFRVHERNDQWSVVNIGPISSNAPLDFVL